MRCGEPSRIQPGMRYAELERDRTAGTSRAR